MLESRLNMRLGPVLKPELSSLSIVSERVRPPDFLSRELDPQAPAIHQIQEVVSLAARIRAYVVSRRDLTTLSVESVNLCRRAKLGLVPIEELSMAMTKITAGMHRSIRYNLPFVPEDLFAPTAGPGREFSDAHIFNGELIAWQAFYSLPKEKRDKLDEFARAISGSDCVGESYGLMPLRGANRNWSFILDTIQSGSEYNYLLMDLALKEIEILDQMKVARFYLEISEFSTFAVGHEYQHLLIYCFEKFKGANIRPLDSQRFSRFILNNYEALLTAHALSCFSNSQDRHFRLDTMTLSYFDMCLDYGVFDQIPSCLERIYLALSFRSREDPFGAQTSWNLVKEIIALADTGTWRDL